MNFSELSSIFSSQKNVKHSKIGNLSTLHELHRANDELAKIPIYAIYRTEHEQLHGFSTMNNKIHQANMLYSYTFA